MEEDPEKILEQTVENLIKNKYFKDEADGLWNIFDEKNGVWKKQKDEPTE
jgi:hypothetical protein